MSILEKMKKTIVNALALKTFFCVALFVCNSLFAADYIPSSVKKIMDTAAEKNASDAVTYLQSAYKTLSESAEKRIILSNLASLQEQLGLYSDAASSYAEAASLAGNASYGVAQLTSEQLVLNAVRCCLSSGDTSTADSYMASAVKNSKNENVISQLRLYTVWSRLCKAQDIQELTEPIVILSSYADMNSMNSVRPAILLTLWYLTDDAEYGKTLQRDFPDSPEAAVTQGKADLMPAPFWYFVPRSADVFSTSETGATATTATAPAATTITTTAPATTASATSSVASKNSQGVKQQVGLFRDKANADSLVARLKNKGFSADITSEKRASGTTYFIVTVAEDEEMSVGMKLKDAGFECYPIFPD